MHVLKMFHNESLEKHTTLAKLPGHRPEEGISFCSPLDLRAGCSGWQQMWAHTRLRRGLGVRVAPTPLMKLDSSLQKAKSSLGLRWKNDGLLCSDPSLEVPVISLQDEVPTPWLNWKHSRASPPPSRGRGNEGFESRDGWGSCYSQTRRVLEADTAEQR